MYYDYEGRRKKQIIMKKMGMRNKKKLLIQSSAWQTKLLAKSKQLAHANTLGLFVCF